MTRYFQIFIFFMVVIYSSYAHQYFFNEGMTSIKPLHWHLFSVSLAIVYVSQHMSSGLKEIPRFFVIWLWLFLINSIVCFFYSSHSEVAEQALMENFTTATLLVSYLLIFQTPNAVTIGRFALLGVVVLAVFMNIYDFFTPTWSKLPGRAAGLYVNPTIAGTMLVLAMVVSVPVIPKKLRLLFCAFVGLGVIITFSRGPWLFWVFALSGLAVSKHIEFGRKITSIVFSSVLAGLVVYSALTGGLLELVSSVGFDEYLTPGTYARLGGSGGAFSDYSTTTRVDAAIHAWEVFAENPWFGAGLGYEKEWVVGSHNTYLRLAAEGGLIRLAIFIGLLVGLWRKTDDIGKVTLFIYAVSCVTTHNNLQAPSILIILALISTVNDRSRHGYQQYELPYLKDGSVNAN